MLSRALLGVSVVAMLPACSAFRGSRCAPISADLIEAFGEVYSECSVHQRARISLPPYVTYNGAAGTRGVTCVVAEVSVVVDERGSPIESTAYISRANDATYAQALLAAVPQMRFSPAKLKSGRAVMQLARYEARQSLLSQRRTNTAGQASTAGC